MQLKKGKPGKGGETELAFALTPVKGGKSGRLCLLIILYASYSMKFAVADYEQHLPLFLLSLPPAMVDIWLCVHGKGRPHDQGLFAVFSSSALRELRRWQPASDAGAVVTASRN